MKRKAAQRFENLDKTIIWQSTQIDTLEEKVIELEKRLQECKNNCDGVPSDIDWLIDNVNRMGNKILTLEKLENKIALSILPTPESIWEDKAVLFNTLEERDRDIKKRVQELEEWKTEVYGDELRDTLMTLTDRLWRLEYESASGPLIECLTKQITALEEWKKDTVTNYCDLWTELVDKVDVLRTDQDYFLVTSVDDYCALEKRVTDLENANVQHQRDGRHDPPGPPWPEGQVVSGKGGATTGHAEVFATTTLPVIEKNVNTGYNNEKAISYFKKV